MCSKSDQVAFITGGSSGLGAAAAKVLAEQGHRVFITARREDKLKAVVDEINAGGKGKAAYAVMDVADEASQKAAFAAAEKEFGGIDFVYVNAGVEGSNWGKKDITDWNESDFKSLYDINCIGAFVTAKYAITALKKRGGGGIAFASSTGTLVNFNSHVYNRKTGMSFQTSTIPYCASKATLNHFAASIAGAYLEDGIKVWSVVIGAFETELTSRVDQTAGKSNSLAKCNPVFRKDLGNPRDLGRALAALMSGTSAWPSGSTFVVDHDCTFDANEVFHHIWPSEPMDGTARPGLPSPDWLAPKLKDLTGSEPYYYRNDDTLDLVVTEPQHSAPTLRQ